MANGLVLRVTLPNEPSSFLDATGGTISYVDGYKVHSFTSAGTFTPLKTGTYEVFMVGPGGEGGTGTAGAGYGGGGAGGEVISTTMLLTSGSSYTVVVPNPATTSGPTAFNGTVAQTGSNGTDGNVSTAGDGGNSITYSGGNGQTQGGGGGAGFASDGKDGFNGLDNAKVSQGGSGVTNDWLGTTKTYGAGGGGGTLTVSGTTQEGQGGSVEAGDGGVTAVGVTADVNGGDAVANSGAGGGGGIGSGNVGKGAAGIVLVRYVNGPEEARYDLDTFEDIPFRVDVSAIQNNTIGAVYGVASQNISLPGSQNNNTFFQAAFNVNSPFARGFKRSVDCQVLQNGVEVFKGNLILNQVVTDGDADTTYDVTIVNESVDFATLVQDQYIAQLDFSDYNHDYSITSVTASWETSSFFNGDIYYPLVDFGNDGTATNVYPIEFGGTVGKVDNTTTPIRIQQFKPAVRAKVLVDKIFESVGYQYSSSFFNSTDFKNIYVMTTADDKLGIVSQQNQDAGFLANKTANQAFVGPTAYAKLTFPSETYDPAAQWSTVTSKFTISNPGTYAFQASLPFQKSTVLDKTAFVVVELYKNGVLLTDQTYNLKTMATGTMNFATAGFSLVAGDEIELYLSWDGEDNGLSGTTLTIKSTATFGTIYAPTLTIGGTVNLSAQFDPAIKSLDFLKGLIEKFNLVLEPKKNQRNTLIVEPFDTWVDAGQVKDWSDKYDRATKVSIKHPIANQPLKLVFQDGFDQDALTDYAKNNFDAEVPYGSHTYVANSDVAQGERKVGGFFSPLPVKGAAGAPQIIIPQMYRLDSGDKKSFKFKPRLGYRIDNQIAVGASAGQFYIYNPETTTSQAFNSYSTISHLQDYPINGGNSLHFNANKWYPFHQNYSDGYTINGAYNTYWGRYINELYDDSARILTLNMKFNPIELKDIQLNDKIFIDNAYYRINKISGFNITDRDNVQVELLKAPVRKFKYPRTRVYPSDDNIGYDVNADKFNPRGDVVVKDDSGVVVGDKDILQDFAVNTGLRFISGSVYWKWDYNPYLNASSEQSIRGSVVVDASAGAVLGAADSSTIGQNVDKAVIIGTDLNIQRDVKNLYIGGDNIVVGSGSVDVSVFSSKDSIVGSDTTFGTLIGTSGSLINGTLNTVIGSQDSKVYNNARQTTLIGGQQIFLDGAANTFSRHTHIGGNAFTYYTTGSSENFTNSVGLGQLPNKPTNAGVDKANKVIIGDSMYTGGVWLKMENRTATAGGTYTFVGDHDTFLVKYTWSGANGTFFMTLPDATVNRGRWMQFFTDGTFNGSTTLNLVCSGSQTINGSPEYPINQSYKGAGIISDGSNWFVIGGA